MVAQTAAAATHAVRLSGVFILQRSLFREYGVYIPARVWEPTVDELCGMALDRALRALYAPRSNSQMLGRTEQSVMAKVSWAQLVNDLHIMLTLDELGSSARIQHPKMGFKKREDPSVFHCQHDAVDFAWESRQKAPPEGRSLVVPLDDDANRFDGPYISFIYPKKQQKPAYLTVRLDQSTTSCGDALRQGLWVLYGSPGSAGFPTFTPMEVEAHIAKYVGRALDTRTNRRRESFTPEPNLVELWKDPTTDKVPLKYQPLVDLLKNSTRTRVCEGSDYLNTLQWSLHEGKDFEGGYLKKSDDFFGKVLGVRFPQLEDLPELGLRVRRLWDIERGRISPLGEDLLWQRFCKDSLLYFVDEAYDGRHGPDDISTLGLKGDFVRVYEADLRQQINSGKKLPSPALTLFEHQSMTLIAREADKEYLRKQRGIFGNKKKRRLTLKKPKKVECSAPRDGFSWTIYDAGTYKGDTSVAPSSMLSKSNREYIVVNMSSSWTELPLAVQKQDINGSTPCSSSLKTALLSLYWPYQSLVTKSEFLQDAQEYLASTSSMSRAERKTTPKKFFQHSAAHFARSGEAPYNLGEKIKSYTGYPPEVGFKRTGMNSLSRDNIYVSMDHLSPFDSDYMSMSDESQRGSAALKYPMLRRVPSLTLTREHSMGRARRSESAPALPFDVQPYQFDFVTDDGIYAEMKPNPLQEASVRPKSPRRWSFSDVLDSNSMAKVRKSIPPPLPPRAGHNRKATAAEFKELSDTPNSRQEMDSRPGSRKRLEAVSDISSPGTRWIDMYGDAYADPHELPSSNRPGMSTLLRRDDYVSMENLSPSPFYTANKTVSSPPTGELIVYNRELAMAGFCTPGVVEATTVVSYALIVVFSAVLLVGIFGITAAYGKMIESGYGSYSFQIDPRLGWFLQEFPSLAFPLLCLLTQWSNLHPCQVLLLGMLILHYLQRSIIYPVLMHSHRKTSISIVLYAFAFCCTNGSLQSAWTRCVFDPSQISAVQLVIGVSLYFTGLLVNLQSDHILRNLRRGAKDAQRYYIPYGGMFRFISCPNYFGEMMEWLGYAMASGWGLAPVTFASGSSQAFCTFANLFPRALQQHKWYQDPVLKPASRRFSETSCLPAVAADDDRFNVNLTLEREVFKRAGASMFLLSNSEYEARSKREGRKAQSELDALRTRAHRQVQPFVALTVVDDGIQQMQQQSKVEEERLRRV
ncbi:3-oxo-5-alpha-steroid 4-dehydrogenase 1 [Perkinsus olseni]|uniref:3-oxo-5-alpha-steroid 4-dehydrogenase 1 n=1 Tax=Perkinsus olseni TaxID=32597 RepID=A0A7J6RQR8_PEROL|nr:3-oxo-5-alpha-steroid 4-dehydrogenase 1 [Perkinsus olseni]